MACPSGVRECSGRQGPFPEGRTSSQRVKGKVVLHQLFLLVLHSKYANFSASILCMPLCVFIPAVGEGISHSLKKSSPIQFFPPMSYICEVISFSLHLLKDSCIQPIVLMVPSPWRTLTSYLYRIYHPPTPSSSFCSNGRTNTSKGFG